MSTTLVGNVTRDPELRFAKSGTAMLTVGLAVNRKRGDEEVTSFFDVVAFGTLAENVAESVAKGMRVVVTGRLEQRSWETDSGERRSKVEVIADEISPSLRWATAAVTRSASDTVSAGTGPNGTQGWSRSARPAPTAYDEEPF